MSAAGILAAPRPRPARARCRVAVVDAGGANLASVGFALQRLGAAVSITADPAALRLADRIVLPGVGAAGAAMRALRGRGLVQELQDIERPLLGICLGMQLFYTRSDEGDATCLGLLAGSVAPLAPAAGLRIPHMGWNRVQQCGASRLLRGSPDRAWFYFVHGYAAPVDAACTASAQHGARFAAVVEQGRLAGVQFHPERSGDAGARLLANFLAWDSQ